ncbi:uncharacterized protein LOC143151853 [Ptiloglossa arizonensis]|uniref:uncharacterized protein LOC143151853 n=1 Tax=Ptiloglossa arizonensis TaxID=3350558 RepID=UPI003FA171ED
MELRALQPISAPAASFCKFTVNRSTIAERETQRRRQRNDGLYAHREPNAEDRQLFRGTEEYRGTNQRVGRFDVVEARETGGFAELETPVESFQKEGTVIEKCSEREPSSAEAEAEEEEEEITNEAYVVAGKYTETEGREGKEEGRPLTGGPHRCGARRGQSAAA